MNIAQGVMDSLFSIFSHSILTFIILLLMFVGVLFVIGVPSVVSFSIVGLFTLLFISYTISGLLLIPITFSFMIVTIISVVLAIGYYTLFYRI